MATAHHVYAAEETGVAQAKWSDTLRYTPADGPKENQRQREESDPEVGEPVAGAKIAQHQHPERVERADHEEHRRSHGNRGDERSLPQEIEREVAPRCRTRLGDVNPGDHR